MTYEEIRKITATPKSSTHTKKMDVYKFPNFSVMISDKTQAILVDNDIVDDVANRRWCIDSGGYPVANYCGHIVRLYDYVMSRNMIEKPDNCYVDHINQDKLDNRKNNLRFATHLENSQNMPLKSDNKTGITGVCKGKRKKYRAYITINKKRMSLGEYDKLEDAAAARREAETRLGFKTRPHNIAFLCEQETFNHED